MLTLTLRDLRHRRRPFAIAVVGAGVVFALTLLLTAMTAGFDAEVRSTVAAAGADRWVVPAGVQGPFTAEAPVREAVVGTVRRRPGVRAAGSLMEFGYVAQVPGGEHRMVNVIGQDADGLVDPALVPARGEVIAGELLGVRGGERIRLGDRVLRVARVVPGASYFAGVPVVRVRLGFAQRLGARGRPVVSAILTRGVPGDLPEGLVALTPAQVRADLGAPVASAKSTIAAVRVLMWLVAALIIGAVTYLSALDRVRDFAVLKAVGVPSRALAGSLLAQAVLAALLAAALAAGLARLMAPAVALPLVFEGTAVLLLLAVALVVGALSSLLALLRVLRVDPALAFAG